MPGDIWPQLFGLDLAFSGLFDADGPFSWYAPNTSNPLVNGGHAHINELRKRGDATDAISGSPHWILIRNIHAHIVRLCLLTCQ